MPLGILTDEDFEKELEKSKSSEKSPSEKTGTIRNIGEGKGQTIATPDVLRKFIADEHLHNGRAEALELAEDLGISSSSVSAYANGSTSTTTYDKPKKDLTDFLRNRRNRIAKRASGKLLDALDEITPDKLANAKVGEIASVARMMAGIVKDVLPEEKSEKSTVNNQVQFLIHAPQIVNESKFEVINVD